MAKAAKLKVRISTQPVVVMEAEVARKIRQHARTSMKAEVCGVLIGSTEHERMTVEACIQGINAAQGGAHVTFTQDTWEHIYKIKDKEFPDHKIVGWYHSHPGFGVFLSEHDLFIQQNFFSNPQQVAWVYDPHTDEEGCFGWIGEKIEKLTAIRVGYSQNMEITGSGANDYEEEGDDIGDSPISSQRSNAREEPAWLRWIMSIMGYAVAILLGFMLCFVFLNWRWGAALEKAHRYDELVQMLQQIEEERRAQNPPVSAGGGAAGAQPGGLQSAQPLPSQGNSPAQKGNNAKH